MTTKMRTLLALMLALCLGLPLAAQAQLIGKLPTKPGGTDYQAYYDTGTGLLWLTDANWWYDHKLQKGTKNSGGQTNLSTAENPLNVPTVTGYYSGKQITVDGWGLPTADRSCKTQKCTGSQLGRLFYDVLGGKQGKSIKRFHNSNYNLFSNITGKGAADYWSSTLKSKTSGNSLVFNLASGTQATTHNNITPAYSWYVNASDPPIPAPSALALMAVGLMLLGLVWGRGRRLG